MPIQARLSVWESGFEPPAPRVQGECSALTELIPEGPALIPRVSRICGSDDASREAGIQLWGAGSAQGSHGTQLRPGRPFGNGLPKSSHLLGQPIVSRMPADTSG